MPTPSINTDRRRSAFDEAVARIKDDHWISRRNPVWAMPGTSTYDDPPPENRWWLGFGFRMLPENPVVANGAGGTLNDAPIRLIISAHAPQPDSLAYIDLWGDLCAALGAGLDPTSRYQLRQRQASSGGFWNWLPIAPFGEPDANGVVRGEFELNVVVPG